MMYENQKIINVSKVERHLTPKLSCFVITLDLYVSWYHFMEENAIYFATKGNNLSCIASSSHPYAYTTCDIND